MIFHLPRAFAENGYPTIGKIFEFTSEDLEFVFEIVKGVLESLMPLIMIIVGVLIGVLIISFIIKRFTGGE